LIVPYYWHTQKRQLQHEDLPTLQRKKSRSMDSSERAIGSRVRIANRVN
jgi:hypothetical protein